MEQLKKNSQLKQLVTIIEELVITIQSTRFVGGSRYKEVLRQSMHSDTSNPKKPKNVRPFEKGSLTQQLGYKEQQLGFKDLFLAKQKPPVYIGIGEKKYHIEEFLEEVIRKEEIKRKIAERKERAKRELGSVFFKQHEKEQKMPSENQDETTTKNAWENLDEKIQDNLINLDVARRKEKLEIRKSTLDSQLRFAIHKALGVKTGDLNRLNFQLKEIVEEYNGGIYDHIRKYIDDYELIKETVGKIAQAEIEKNPAPAIDKSQNTGWTR